MDPLTFILGGAIGLVMGVTGAGDRVHMAELNSPTGRFVWTRRAAAGFVGIGAVTGFVSGLLLVLGVGVAMAADVARRVAAG